MNNQLINSTKVTSFSVTGFFLRSRISGRASLDIKFNENFAVTSFFSEYSQPADEQNVNRTQRDLFHRDLFRVIYSRDNKRNANKACTNRE